MATIDLGKIKQVFRGTYNNSTAYVPDDLVVFTDGSVTSTYICTTATTGNNPSSGGTAHGSWAFVAKGQATSPTTTQGDVIVRGASADERLAIGTAGQVLKVNSSANGLEYGTGFAGTHYLAYSNRHDHGTTVSINGSTIPNGTSDGQRDCIVINNGLYHTITPSHVDDFIVMHVGSTINLNANGNGQYYGLGIQSSTATNFSANRNIPFQTGQHSNGNGSAVGDPYDTPTITMQLTANEMGLAAGTTYYIRGIGQVHSRNQTINFNNGSGTRVRSQYFSWLRHYKRNV